MANATFTCSKSILFSYYYIYLTLLKQFEEHIDCTVNLAQYNVDFKRKCISDHSLGGAVHMRTSVAPHSGLVLYSV